MGNASIISLQGHGSPACISCAGPKGANGEYISALDQYNKDITHMNNDYERNGIDDLGNIPYPSIIYSFGCVTMPFDKYVGYHSYDNIPYNMGSAYTMYEMSGGVGYIGNTRDEYLDFGPYLENQFAKELVRYRSIGIAHMMSKANFTHNLSNVYNKRSKVISNLLGDPEFKVWMGAPANRIWPLDNSNNITYAISGNDISGCTISLYDGSDKTYMAKVAYNSQYAILNLNELIGFNSSNDICCISIWKDNYLPKFYLTQNTGVSVSSKKSFMLPELEIINSDTSTPCYYIKNSGELTIETVGDITLDGVLYIEDGGTVTLKSRSTIHLKNLTIKAGGTLNLQSNNLDFGE